MLGIILLILACEENEDGCLDLRAANFNVNAVTSCDSCCVFPQARLDIDLIFDTLSFNFGTAYPINQGVDTIRMTAFRLPFSDFVFSNSTTSYQALDTMLNVRPTNKDDFLIIESTSIEPIGFTDFVDVIEAVDFIVGYDRPRLEGLQPFIELHPTIRALEVINRFYVDTTDTYFMAELSVEIGDSLRRLQVSMIQNQSLRIDYEEPIELSLGLPWNVPVNLDVNVMLDGIKPEQTNELMAATIGDNISAAITGN